MQLDDPQDRREPRPSTWWVGRSSGRWPWWMEPVPVAVFATLVTVGYVLDDEKGHGWVIAVEWAIVAAIFSWSYLRRGKRGA